MADAFDSFSPLTGDPIKHYEDRIKLAAPAMRRNWKRAEENENFVRAEGGDTTGNQWPDDDYVTRKDQNLPVLQINDTILAVNAISGREVTSRFEPTYLGQDEGPNDQGFANVCRQFSHKVRERGDYEHVDSDGFRKLHIENYSWFEWIQDLSKEPFGIGQTRIVGVPIYEMAWDQMASETNLSDMIWNARGRWVGYEEAAALFPIEGEREALEELRKSGEAKWVDEDFVGGWPGGTEEGDAPWLWKQARSIFLVDYTWRTQETHYIVDVSNPEPSEGMIEPPQYEEAESAKELEEIAASYKRAFRSELAYAPIPRWRYHYAYIVGNKTVQTRESPVPQFNRQVMTSFPWRRRSGVTHYSTVDLMKDGQQFRNMVFSMAISLFQNSAKQPLLVEELALKNPEQADNYTKIGGVVMFREGRLGAFKEGQQPSWPPAFEQMLQHATEAVWRPIGLTPASLGQIADPRRVSGTVFEGIQDSVEKVLSYPFDALRMYRKQSARIMLDHMEVYYDEETVARMVGGFTVEQAQQTDPEQLKGKMIIPPKSEWRDLRTFDVLVDESSRSKSQMHETARMWVDQGLATSLIQQQLMPADILPDMMPGLPEPARQRWIAHLTQMAEAAAAEPTEEQP